MAINPTSNNPFRMVTFDNNVLGAYYSSGVSLGLSGHAAQIQKDLLDGSFAKVDPAVIPPWTLPRSNPYDEILQRIFSTGPLIDLDDPRVNNTAGDDQFKNLFGLFNGLTKLREMATYAESDSGALSRTTILQQRFDGYLAEAKNFVDGLEFEDTTLLYGLQQSSMTSSLSFPKDPKYTTLYHEGASLTEVRTDAIGGLVGNETFDITVVNSVGTTVVNIDLSAVSGALNVDNVADYINGQLSAAGVTSTMQSERYSEDSYGLKLNLNSTETVTLGNASDEIPGLYIAGTRNVGDYASGYVRKVDDLGNTAPSDAFRSDTDTDKADSARAIAVDSRGNVYSVGSTAGDLGGLANQAVNDAYLRKYDVAGELVWSRLLGATEDAAGFAVAVDVNDNVVIAGSARGVLTETAYGGNYDSFVTKFDGTGAEQWTRQAAPYANDSALALTTDASGNIFVAGQTASEIGAGVTHAGGTDGYLTKLDSSGTHVWDKQFGGTGNDRATAVAVDGSGNIYVAGEKDGNAILRSYVDSDASQTPVWEVDLGALNSDGAVTGIAVGSSGNVYISGQTSNAALSGSIVNAHSGGTDGFVSQIIDSGVSAAAGFTTYVGSSSTDTLGGIAVKALAGADEIYVTGATQGAVDGGAVASAQDAFVMKLDNTGTEVWAHQDHSAVSQAGNAIAYDPTATSVISRLGLTTGDLPAEPGTEVLSLTTARPGQYFSVRVNGGATKRVEIESDDSLGLLAVKINNAMGQYGSSTLQRGAVDTGLKLEARNGAVVEIIAGPDGSDALASLGLTAGVLYAAPAGLDDTETDVAKAKIFELGITGDISLKTTRSASEAGVLIDNALREVRKMFRFIAVGPEDDRLSGLNNIKPADAERLAQMQGALSAISGIASSMNLTNQMRLNGQGGGSVANMLNIIT
ncbi:MAG: SBBP repeat-containing protein [Proteobacteria bacterium]|nr:SBBP repeat-containing protein [Pseudomonadota bacterium]